jgi:2-methylcitrate synthase
VLGAGLRAPEKDDHNHPDARDIADKLMARSARCCCTGTTSATTARIDVETDDDSIAGHFLHLLHGEPPSDRGCAPCTPR